MLALDQGAVKSELNARTGRDPECNLKNKSTTGWNQRANVREGQSHHFDYQRIQGRTNFIEI